MKLGVLARATDRGLGIQTWEVTRHLDSSSLIVHAGEDRHDDRFPGATIAELHRNSFRHPQAVKQWLTGVDVVYTAETFYDPRFTKWCRERNVRTVCHLNPEFWLPGQEPTAWWSATPWRRTLLPRNMEVVPFPVATERWTPEPLHDDVTRWLHVGGRRAGWDRNGTDCLLAALPLLREPCRVTVASQSDKLNLPKVPSHVHIDTIGPVANYWDVYPGHDMLVMPRRYGGLCLPVQEAMGAGLGVLMPHVSPNFEAWPAVTFPSTGWTKQKMYAGEVPVAELNPADLAAAMDRFGDPAVRHAAQLAGREWASEHSWDRQAPLWLERFEALL